MEIRLDVHLSILYGNSYRAVRSLQRLLHKKDAAEWKIICRLQGGGGAFDFDLSALSPYMTAVIQIWADLEQPFSQHL